VKIIRIIFILIGVFIGLFCNFRNIKLIWGLRKIWYIRGIRLQGGSRNFLFSLGGVLRKYEDLGWRDFYGKIVIIKTIKRFDLFLKIEEIRVKIMISRVLIFLIFLLYIFCL